MLTFIAWTLFACSNPAPPSAPLAELEAPAHPPNEVGPPVPVALPDTPDPPPEKRCNFDSQDDDACFVQIGGASFLMGAQAADPSAPNHDAAAAPEEGPPRQVEVSSFWIHRNEVSVSLYARCVEARQCEDAAPSQGGVSNWRGENWRERFGHPINSVDWATADAICRHAGGRLPTEAEWELAARGTDGRRWPWGNEPGCGVVEQAGFRPDGTARSAGMHPGPCEELGTRLPRELRGESPYRLTGMAGSLWEWTSDEGPGSTPERPERMQRGGGWTSTDPTELRTTVRQGVPVDQKLVDVGVRCVWGRG